MPGTSVKFRSVLVALILFSSLAIAGCSNSDSNSISYDDATSSGDSATDAYNFGYEASSGASQALIDSFGGVQQYCEGLLPLHPDFNSQEQADYIRGCIDANS